MQDIDKRRENRAVKLSFRARELDRHSERSETKRRNLPLLFLVRVSRLIAVVCFSIAVFQTVDPHVGCEAHPPQGGMKGTSTLLRVA